MHVHRSNRMENLAAALADVVRTPAPGSGPFDPECIVVQGRGMERWVSMRLAEALGVWANPWFPFPRTLLEEAFAAVLGEPDPERRFSPEAATWSVASLLPELADREEMAPIRRYLAGGDEAARRLQLASRIAQVLDRYVVYRPSMIRRWEEGDDGELPHGQRWQPLLWRALMERGEWVHLARRAEAFYRALRAGDGPVEGLPRRISLFGISALPPRYLRMFVALSRRVDVHLFMMSPSAEYWADIRSRRDALRERARLRGETELPDDLEWLEPEEGHPLLASLGKVGRDFQAVLESIDDYAESDVDLYDEPRGDGLLHSLQRDMLHLSEGSPHRDPRDGTVRIHSCHGPMREIEVLHDQLLELLVADPTLEPQDIVVMTPDIDAYAPVIEAVFERPDDDPTRLPYRVADRGVRQTHAVVDAFEDLLDVLSGRMPASAVLDLLGAGPVREKFAIGTDEIETVRRWIVEAGIRWGVDADHRAAEGQPRDPQNTWRFGLDRLVVGWAVDARDDRVCAGVSPYDDVEGGAGDLLGRLLAFSETLFSLRDAVTGERTVAEWRGVLSDAVDRTLAATPETAGEHQLVRRALAEMAERAERAGFDEPVGLRALRPLLAEAMERDVPVRSFLSGGVTFCQLVPMRSIPFRVVCLVGMNDDAFPRAQRALGFDLTAPPRSALGDRTPRDDDRYLFLEALLSARERLLVTYVGQSIHDNAELPPSVLVSEMVDALARPLPLEEREAFRQALVVRHPLQPFSPRYFDGSSADLFGYSERHAAGARSLCAERRPPPPFVERPLVPDEPDGARVVTLDDLERFFKRPLPTFLQRRLGLYLGDDAEPVPDREPIALDGLATWKVGDRVVARALGDGRTDAAAEAVRASGALPLGRAGDVEWDRIAPVAEEVVARARSLVPGAPVEPRMLEETLAGVELRGVLRQLRPQGQLDVRYSRLGRASELALWIRHLALGVGAPDLPMRSVLVGRGKQGEARAVWFGEVEHAKAVLEDLVKLYVLGQTVPLLLFEGASRAFAETMRAPKGGPEAAWRRARKAYQDWDAADPHVRQVFGDVEPLEPGYDPFARAVEGYPLFDELAERVWGPLLDHRSEASPDDAEGEP